MKFKRILLIVLDGVGCGELPDAEDYGDVGAHTLAHVAQVAGGLQLPTLQRLGLGNITPIAGVEQVTRPAACWGKMRECSVGKDSTTGHWEIAGGVQTRPYATYPEGFPPEIIAIFRRLSGKEPLGNVVISGTDALEVYGEQHLASGRPIVYTSVDSVFQIAAHEDVLPPEQLYELCRAMRRELDAYRVGRVIARPFVGTAAHNFKRTSRRRDFSLQPPENVLDKLAAVGLPVVAIGKINDIFCGRGISEHLPTKNNGDGMDKIATALQTIDSGLIFANLIDYDMLYGHRRDAQGFAAALVNFDQRLGALLAQLLPTDLMLITADHGCDPTTPGTDHSREYVPLVAFSPRLAHGQELGVRNCFCDISATISENFGVDICSGTSFLSNV
ncbi:MAG: phosphopentomutase [Desulfuromonas sp.]|nr:phosphopentomutase [Desulfuromonas sp.]